MYTAQRLEAEYSGNMMWNDLRTKFQFIFLSTLLVLECRRFCISICFIIILMEICAVYLKFILEIEILEKFHSNLF